MHLQITNKHKITIYHFSEYNLKINALNSFMDIFATKENIWLQLFQPESFDNKLDALGIIK